MDIQSTVFYSVVGLIVAMMVGLASYSDNRSVYSQQSQNNQPNVERISVPS